MDIHTLVDKAFKRDLSDASALSDAFDVLRLLEAQDGFEEAHRRNKEVRRLSAKYAAERTDAKMFELNKRSLLFDAPYDFDCFLRYIEWQRPNDKRFYMPRRKVLLPIVNAFQQVADGELDLLTVSQPKRTGKAMPMYTKVLTPCGYREIGELRVGDTVISANGNQTIVTGVFPQGEKEIYEVVFSETGKCPQKTVVECCKEHLWTVRTEEDRATGKSRVLSCEDMLNGTIKRSHDRHNNYSVDYILPVEFEGKGDLDIPPYLMGQLIGDGSFRSGVKITTADEDVLERIKSELPEGDKIVHIRKYDYRIVKTENVHDEKGYMVKSATGKAIEKYGLDGKLAFEKHIPIEYLYSSIKDRIDLLRGLFDSDAGVTTNGAEFSTTSKQLAEDVSFLVRGLGGRVRTTERMGAYTKNGKRISTRKNYRVYCQFPSSICPFWLERKKKKYNPKRHRLYRFVDEIRATKKNAEMVCISVSDESEQFVVGESMVPTHNTTLGLMFVLFRAGRHPGGSSICSGAGNDLVKSFYTGCLDILQKPEEYLYYDVFPTARLAATNADEKTIHLEKKKRFATITCRSIDGALTGSTESTPDGVMYLDDLVSDELEANNRNRLDTLWDKVRGDLLGRRLEGCPIVAQGTRYSLYDPLGRLQEIAPTMGWRTKVVEIPALDPVTDESNFEIILNGKPAFTTEYYRHERELVTPVQWASQFQQEPFEAKGLLFPENELNRYFELPVDQEPDAIISVCDTAEGGGDSVMMPIAYIYGEDVFIEDCVFDNSTPEHTKPECAKKLVDHKVSVATFESNNAGSYFARDVEELVKKMGGRVSIRTRRTISNKQTRIEMASDGILKHFYFKDKSLYKPSDQYGQMMRELVTYTRTGKVKHDDSPDGLSLLENEIRNLTWGKAEVFRRPF